MKGFAHIGVLRALERLGIAVDEVIVDTDEAYERAQAAMHAFMPRTKTKLVRYRDRMPLFSRFQLERQLESIFEPIVALPSGGSIVIEGTEALTSIDVNSGRSTRAGSQEETAFRTNLEAVQEVARQLRLRDIGGLIVVDLIDMRSSQHQREIEKTLREAVKTDRARVAVGRISPNGLLEINRQRLKTPLVLRTHRVCPTCGGRGRIPSPETVSLSVMRRIEERAAVGGITGVRIRLHPELADAFQNNYRAELAAIEAERGIRIEIIAQPGLHRSEEEVDWIKEHRHEEEPEPADQAAVRVTDLTTGGGRARPHHSPETPGSEAAGSVDEPKPHKRRRPSRRKKKPAAVPEPAAAVTPQRNEHEPDAHMPTPTSETTEETTTAPRKRRRPNRRRRKPATQTVTPHEPAAAPADQPAPHVGTTPSAVSGEAEANDTKTKSIWDRLFGE